MQALIELRMKIINDFHVNSFLKKKIVRDEVFLLPRNKLKEDKFRYARVYSH